MLMETVKVLSSLHSVRPSLRFSSARTISSLHSLEELVKASVESKNYEEIPDLLAGTQISSQKSNPFSFLTNSPVEVRTHIIDDMLQSFLFHRPRFRPRIAYSCLLSYTLQSPDPLPLAFAVLQHMLRSGCLPVPETHILLSGAWLDRLSKSQTISNILLEMQSIGYHPDCGICNYLILSLCRVNQLKEAVKVLKSMLGAGCVPDLDSYGTLIGKMAGLRMTNDVVKLMKEMMETFSLSPRQQLLVKVAKMFRANKEFSRAVDMIVYLESMDVLVGFDVYDLVLEGCLHCREFVIAGKLVMRMTGKGYIPYINVRQRVVEGLLSIGKVELASAVRSRLVNVNS